jgi:hypothetical protein
MTSSVNISGVLTGHDLIRLQDLNLVVNKTGLKMDWGALRPEQGRTIPKTSASGSQRKGERTEG